MSGFGGLCPLPLRLGGDGTTGWTAGQFTRAACDLLATMRTAPFAVVVITNGAIVYYAGQNGQGLSYAPTLADLGGGDWTLTWPATWTHDTGEEFATQITSAQAFVLDTTYTRTEATGSGNVVTAFHDPGEEPTWVVRAYGSPLQRRTLADYGASLDKCDTDTERTPYAWTSYRALQDARGSAYSRDPSGLVHVENLCLARGHAALWRHGERLSTNANPATATEALADWQSCLGVAPRAGDTQDDTRARCGARFAALIGPTRQAIDDAVSGLLGTSLVRIWREWTDDFTNPPPATYWPGVTPGTVEWDLGNGEWSSERARVLVELVQPVQSDLATFNAKIDQLAELLDRALPAYMTWDWAVNAEDGFVLDSDLLDEAAMGAT